MSAARAVMLAAICQASARIPPQEPEPRAYRRELGLTAPDVIARFESRLRDYDVTVLRATTDGIAEAAAAQLATRGIDRLLVPADLPEHWRPPGLVFVPDAGQSARTLNGIPGVMAGCAVAVAESGTIVLDAGQAQGRRAVTLLPDYLLCVVMTDQVVGLLPQAMGRLRPAIDAGRPITFVSGPSATADIELNRVRGVHGPRTLDVVLAG
jgi:L-lactate dehydrogenase complex protein LldG